jgi:hypothetical protein
MATILIYILLAIMGELVHLWVGDETNWVHKNEVIYTGAKLVSPTSIRFGNLIDVYCVNTSNQIVHLWVSDLTNWLYQQ